jgi:hypothetical protein
VFIYRCLGWEEKKSLDQSLPKTRKRRNTTHTMETANVDGRDGDVFWEVLRFFIVDERCGLHCF